MVGGPPPPKGVILSMPPVVPIEPYQEPGACRYGGPYKRPKQIRNAKDVLETKTNKPLLEAIPAEIICEIIGNLPGKELKSLTLCNQALNEIVTPILYKRFRLSTLSALYALLERDLPEDYAVNVFFDPEKNKEADKRFTDLINTLPTGKKASLIKRLDNIAIIDHRSWHYGHELLRRLPGLEDIGFPWLGYHRGFHQLSMQIPQEPKDSSGKQLDSEKRRVDRLVSEFGETTMKNITHTTFTWTTLATFKKVLSHLPKLQKLYTFVPDRSESYINLSDADFRQIIPTITATVGSTLVKLTLSRAPEMAYIDDFIRPLGDRSKFPSLRVFNIPYLDPSVSLEDKSLRRERAKLLYEICKASKRHGQWRFPHKSFQIGVLELACLEAEQIKTLYLWLCENIPRWDGEIVLEETSLLNPTEVIPELESFLKKMDKIADVVPLKLRIDSIFPPTKDSGLLPTVKKFAPQLVQLTISPSMLDPDGEVDDQELTISSVQLGFLEWTSFLEKFLPLCKNMHTFRTISQANGDGVDISLAGKLEKTFAKLCRVHKLRHLDIDLASLLQPETVAGSVLFGGKDEPGEGPRKVIQGIAWISTPQGTMMRPDFSNCLQNLRTLKLKNLFIFRQVEMVWFTNLTAKLKNLELVEVRGFVWHLGYEAGESESEDGNDWKRKNADDDEWEDSDANPDEIPSLKEVGEQIGKLSLVNRLDADSSLLSWLPEDSGSDSDSESEESEDSAEKRLAHDDDDDDDIQSTDSGFGSDPRFTKVVNEELRIARLKGWLCKVLVETAKKTGGRCRKVVIKDLRVDGRGMDPWALDDSLSAYSNSSDMEEYW